MSLDDEDIESNARVSSRVTTSLNVRRQADMSAQIVVKLSPGTGLDVTDEVTGGNYQVGNEIYNNWFEVNVEGVIGFAAAFYVDRLSTGPTGPTGPIPEVMSLGEVSTRVQSVLNLREAADTGSASLGKLEPGTRLKIKEKLIGEPYTAGGTSHTDWLEVEVDDKTGFVAAFYVDSVLQIGKVNSLVTTRLRVRKTPAMDGDQVGALAPNTRFTILGGTTGGPYDAQDTTRNDWYEIDVDTVHGFVAAFFVDLIDDEERSSVNAILFTYDPLGASDRTARQDGLPARGIHGVAASKEMAKTDQARMGHKAKFVAAARRAELPPALLAAIASRESRGGNALDDGWGDGGNAFGIMQVDKRFHSPIETDGGPAGQAHIDQATEILRDKLDGVERAFESMTDSQNLQTAVSRYNGGLRKPAPDSDEGTTGGDYMNDVWARARFYATVEDW